MFDGNNKLIKSSSLARFHRKLKTNVKFRGYPAAIAKAKLDKGIPVDATQHRKRITRQFSFLGSSRRGLKNRNFISYANFAAEIMQSQK